MPEAAYWVKTGAALAFTAVTLYLAYLFFTAGVALIRTQAVFAGIVATVVGFAFLSASVTVIRDWVLAVKAERGRETRVESPASS